MFGAFSSEIQGIKSGSQQRKIKYILQFFYYKGKNASKASVIVNGVYGANTLTANYKQL